MRLETLFDCGSGELWLLEQLGLLQSVAVVLGDVLDGLTP
jgi:hypothetical protein